MSEPRVIPEDRTTPMHSCSQDDMEAEFDGKFITVEESCGMAILSIDEARALRDFLTKVLP